jgi:hypothetical protein
MAATNEITGDGIVNEVRKVREDLLKKADGNIHLVAEKMRAYTTDSGRKSISVNELNALRIDHK